MSPLVCLLLIGGLVVADPGGRFDRVLYDFADGETVRAFRPINDGVMGGVSSGAMVARPGEGGVFRGVVSFDNNGGFASVRSVPERFDLAGFRGMVLRVRGDGKTYKLVLKTSAAFDGIQYQARFQPSPGLWESHTIPFDAFVPTFRGRVVAGTDPLDPSRITTVGLMISDRQEGPFTLSVERIGAYR